MDKLKSTIQVKHYDFDPGATSLTAVGWVAMKNFGAILASFCRTIGTGDVAMSIYAATDASGTDAAEVVAKTVSSQPDAVGDYIFLECGAEQIRALGETNSKAYSHVSAYVSVATGTDEGVVTYILGEARVKKADLTADNIAA